MTPYVRLKELREDLAHHQMLNRIAMNEYNAGLKRIKQIEDEIGLMYILLEKPKARKPK